MKLDLLYEFQPKVGPYDQPFPYGQKKAELVEKADVVVENFTPRVLDEPALCRTIRGGDVISYLGFNVATRPWVEKNGETIEKFLAAVAEADKWMRANPKQAAQVATRWIPGLKPDVAEAAMQFNIQQNDRRLSANNYRALWAAQDRLNRLGILKSTFDVNKHIEPKHILKVMQDKPELFSDLPPIPAEAALKPGYVFKP